MSLEVFYRTGGSERAAGVMYSLCIEIGGYREEFVEFIFTSYSDGVDVIVEDGRRDEFCELVVLEVDVEIEFGVRDVY